MPIIRPTALRSLQSSLRHSGARASARSAPSRTQLVVRRYASSGGHGGGHGEASSDLPWLLGAVAITPPACWYLWPEPHAEHHGSHGGHEDHAEAEEGEEKEAGGEDEESQEASAPAEQSDEPEKGAEAEDKPDEKSEGGDDSKDEGDEKSSDSKDKEESDGEDKQEEGGEEKQGGGSDKNTQGKGKMKEDSEGFNETRKSESMPPSRGTNKKRIDSGLGKNLGEGATYEDDDPPKKESQATAKPEASNIGDISKKQKGLSTTDTRHSVAIDERDDKSKKGTGEPETAKAKGTVDTNAPVR